MHRIRQEDLPFVGSSHQFIGADQGDVGISVFLLSALPGRGPGPHRHPYDEVQFVRSGRGLWKVDGVEFEAGAGDCLVVKAGEGARVQVHRRRAAGAGRRAPEPALHPGEPVDPGQALGPTVGSLRSHGAGRPRRVASSAFAHHSGR
jgi:quercetin dioxygenase-like cupin family protein